MDAPSGAGIEPKKGKPTTQVQLRFLSRRNPLTATKFVGAYLLTIVARLCVSQGFRYRF
jgi:hypothetical protein